MPEEFKELFKATLASTDKLSKAIDKFHEPRTLGLTLVFGTALESFLKKQAYKLPTAYWMAISDVCEQCQSNYRHYIIFVVVPFLTKLFEQICKSRKLVFKYPYSYEEVCDLTSQVLDATKAEESAVLIVGLADLLEFTTMLFVSETTDFDELINECEQFWEGKVKTLQERLGVDEGSFYAPIKA